MPGLTVRRFSGYSNREIDILRGADLERRALTENGGNGEIRVTAGPDCEVGVKRYAYCRRNLLFALTFQWRSGELMRGGWISDGFGIKIVRFFREIRGDSNRIIHYRLAITLISEKELPTGRKCCADWG